MYDVLRARYTFACPSREQASVPLSAFRVVERLPGAAHPAVFRVRFACICGNDHDGLVAHDDLDWAPLGVGEERTYLNLMTDRLELVREELGDIAARHIRGEAESRVRAIDRAERVIGWRCIRGLGHADQKRGTKLPVCGNARQRDTSHYHPCEKPKRAESKRLKHHR